MPRVMRLPNISLLPILPSPGMEKRQHPRDSKEDTIHDPKGKTRFEHRTLFIRRKMQTIHARRAEDAKADLV